jgi:hypothetical protein
MNLLRHGRACHCKSDISDLQHILMRKSGKPDFRCHPRLASSRSKKDVDACDIGVRKHAVLWTAMRGHDAMDRWCCR